MRHSFKENGSTMASFGNSRSKNVEFSLEFALVFKNSKRGKPSATYVFWESKSFLKP